MVKGQEILDRVVATYNRHDWDALARLWTPDAKCLVPGGRVLRGGEAWAEYSRRSIESIPDARVVVHHAIIEDRAVVQESMLVGTHSVAMQLPDGTTIEPTGSRLEIPYVEIFWLEGQRIGETHLYLDPNEPIRQLRRSGDEEREAE